MRISTTSMIAVLATTAPFLVASRPLAAETHSLGDRLAHRSEWRASTFSASRQAEAALDVGPDGSITVVWSSRRQQGGTYGVFAQRFDRAGVAIGPETTVNLWTHSHQRTPAVAAQPDGGALAVWQSHGQDGEAGSIVARRLVSDGSGGSEVLVNETTSGHQARPVIAADPRGGAIVAWVHAPADGGPCAVRARRLDATGAPVGSEIEVIDDGGVRSASPAVAVHDDGAFVIAFAVASETGRPLGISARAFDAAGAPRGASAPVSPPGAGAIEPAIAALPNGCVVTWLEPGSSGGDFRVLARRVGCALAAEGPPIEVDPASSRRGPQTAATVTARPDGRYAIAWNARDDDEIGIFARLFDCDGAPLGDAARLNDRNEGSQAMETARGARRLASGPAGELLCVWSGDGGRGDSSSVNVTMLAPQPVALAGRRQGVDPAAAPAAAPDPTGVAQPHVPPTFDPRQRVKRPRQRGVTEGAGGEVGFTGVFNTGWTPPDPTLAVGPEHVVVMTNGEIGFFTKDGTQTFSDEIEGSFGFWGSVGATSFVFDPEAHYDPVSERFYVMAAEDAGATSYVLLAISDNSNPNGAWIRRRISTSSVAGGLFDSPNLSIGADAVYISGDGFPGGPATYPVLIFDKADLISGLPATPYDTIMVTGTNGSAGIPPVVFDDPGALYLIAHREQITSTNVMLIALTDPLGTPALTSITVPVPSYGRPEDPPQSGTTFEPETFDARFWSVAYRGGSLWATHHVDAGRIRARWYEIAMNGWPFSGDVPNLVQSGEIDPGGQVRTFFSAITVDAFGNATMTFARSAPDEFISMATAYRYASDPPGSFREMIIRQTSTGPSFSDRWGDYSGAAIDPVDDRTAWAHHEYLAAGSWRTWVQQVIPEFDPADLDYDGTVGVDDLLILLGAWGPCADCAADIDGDGNVDVDDLLALLGAWGEPV